MNCISDYFLSSSLITEQDKKKIQNMTGVAGLFGAASAVMGLVLKLHYGTPYPAAIDGYFGVMSGFAYLIIGTVGDFLLIRRHAALLSLYQLILSICDILCIVDLIIVVPYSISYGRFGTHKLCNYKISHSYSDNCNDVIDSTGALYICIPVVLGLLLLSSFYILTLSAMALRKARTFSGMPQLGVQLTPMGPHPPQPTDYNMQQPVLQHPVPTPLSNAEQPATNYNDVQQQGIPPYTDPIPDYPQLLTNYNMEGENSGFIP